LHDVGHWDPASPPSDLAYVEQHRTPLRRAAPCPHTRMVLGLGVDEIIGQPALNHVDDASDCVSSDGVDERIGPAKAVSGGNDIVHREERIGGIGRFLLENVTKDVADVSAAASRDST
jgi:hypothetical protein